MNRRSARNRHRRDPFPLPIEHMVAIRHSPDHIERTVDGLTITAVDEKNGTVTVR